MKQDHSQSCQLLFASADGRKIGRLERFRLLCIELEKLIVEDSNCWPPHQQLIEVSDSAFEFLGAADDFFNDDPTPQFLYGNTGGEPAVSSHELWMTNFNKKQQLTR